MSVPFIDLVDCRQFARRFATLLDTQLIWYKHYHPWSDAVIRTIESPPLWILKISTIKYSQDAVRAANEFAHSEPFEQFNLMVLSDLNVACRFRRYELGAISWATFLSDAGQHVDSNDGREECEYFFQMLSSYEDSEYSSDLLSQQTRQVTEDFADVIAEICEIHEIFMVYFRQYVECHRN